MKKFFLAVFMLFLAPVALAQRGLYHEDRLSFGSNFLKDETAIGQVHLDLGIGYRFSEKFRLGFLLGYGYMAFRDEAKQKAQSLSMGMGLSGNFRCFANEAIALHSDTRIYVGSPSREALADWGFFSVGTELQTYFLSIANERTKPYISLGISAIYGGYEKNNFTIERTYFMPHIGLGIVTQF